MRKLEINNPDFLKVCELAKQGDTQQLQDFYKEKKTLKIIEWVSLIPEVKMPIDPIFFLTYQGEHKAIQTLSHLNFDSSEPAFEEGWQAWWKSEDQTHSQALKYEQSTFNESIAQAYALAGAADLEGMLDDLKGIPMKSFFSIGFYSALSGTNRAFHLPMFSQQKEFQERDLAILDGFIKGLSYFVPIQHPQYLYKWLKIDNSSFEGCEFLNNLLQRLHPNRDPFKSLTASQKARLEVKLFKNSEKIIAWSALYVWLQQGPKSKSINLPLVMFGYVASFISPKYAVSLTNQASKLSSSFMLARSSINKKNFTLTQALREQESLEEAKAIIESAEEYSFGPTT